MRIKSDDVVAFVIPFVMFVQVRLVGTLLATDILSLCCFALYAASAHRRTEIFGASKILLSTYVIWLLGAILTDLYRDTPFDYLALGWSKIIFFGLSFSALCMASMGRMEVLRAYLLGICAGWLVRIYFFPDDYILEYPWKFGYSQAFTPAVAILASFPSIKRHFGLMGQVVPLLIVAVVNLMFDYRSMFGVAAAAAFICVLKYVLDRWPGWRVRVSPASFIFIVLLGVGTMQGVMLTYMNLAASGVLGLSVQEKYEDQITGDSSILVFGRSEILVSTQAIVDSPILGHGSWARDMTYVLLLVEKLENLGRPILGDVIASDLIPTHSHLFGAWVESGIGGGLFWMVVFWLGVTALYRMLKLENAPTPLLAFFLLLMLWDVLFSPFGQDQRFIMASKIAIALWVLRQPVWIAPTDQSRS